MLRDAMNLSIGDSYALDIRNQTHRVTFLLIDLL